MPMKLLSADDFRTAAKGGERPDATVFRFALGQPKTVGAPADRTKRFVFSDATVDHADDSIDPKGWNLGIFKRNPVALFSHMSWEPPIGRAPYVGVEGKELVGDIQFATAEVYEFADTIYRLVDGGFLNAVSVGFKPDDWAFSSDKDRPYGIDFKKQTLLEISVCPVPCNPNALGEARSLGIDTRSLVDWAEKVLDNGETVFLPRKDIEALRLQAKGVEPPRYYVQHDGSLTQDQAERVRDAVKRWQADPTEVLVLPAGLTLRTVGERRSSEDWKCGAAQDLPLDEEGTWDGAAAEASIFDHAGGDDFDPAIACRGFLAYDASAPKLRGSYKLPFAQLVGGELKAMASGVRAAASRLPQAEIPDSVQEAARAALDVYEAKMGDKAAGARSIISRLFVAFGVEPSPELQAKLAAILPKAGRRISAANKAKLQDALDHHDAATKCIKDVMSSDGEMDDGDDLDDDGGTPTPDQVGPDDPIDMSPEEKRVKEARDLKASLPPID